MCVYLCAGYMRNFNSVEGDFYKRTTKTVKGYFLSASQTFGFSDTREIEKKKKNN